MLTAVRHRYGGDVVVLPPFFLANFLSSSRFVIRLANIFMAALGRSKPPISERFAIGDGLSLFYSSAPARANKATPVTGGWGNESMEKLMERAIQPANKQLMS